MIDDPLTHSGLGGEVRVRGNMDQVFGTRTMLVSDMKVVWLHMM